MESVQSTKDSMFRVSSLASKEANCAPVRAAHSSSRGTDNWRLGATLDLAVMKATSTLPF